MKIFAALLLSLIVVSPTKAGWLWGPNYRIEHRYYGTSMVPVTDVVSYGAAPRTRVVHKHRHIHVHSRRATVTIINQRN